MQNYSYKINCGANHIFEEKSGSIYCAGKNKKGQLGIGNLKSQSELCKIPSKFQLSHPKISTSCANHTIFLMKGKVFLCGEVAEFVERDEGYCFETSDYDWIAYSFIEEYEELNNQPIIEVFSGEGTCFFKSNNNKCFAIGWNLYGKLGIDEKESNQEIVMIPSEISAKFEKNEEIAFIKGGNAHTLLLTNKGNVFSVGLNDNGRLGLDSKHSNPIVFTKISYFSKKKIKIVAIDCGIAFSLFLSSKGEVYGCGSNKSAQIGLPEIKDYFEPTLISSLSKNITKIKSGGSFSFFLTEDKKIFACGDFLSEISKKSKPNTSIPQEISYYFPKVPFLHIIDIYCCDFSAFFVNNLGEIYSFGRNKYGECCLGHFNKVRDPTLIADIRIGAPKRPLLSSTNNTYIDMCIKTDF